MLGKADDVFRGGSGDDFVEAEGPLISGPGIPEQVEGLDRISAGDGSDEVTIGLAGATTSDVVDLGRGEDGLLVSGLPSPDVRPDGGAGSDFLRINPDEEGHAWDFDNVTETATRDGMPQARWDSFQRFSLTWLGAASTTFTGSDRDEVVGTGPDLLSATLGGGDDLIGVILPEDRVLEIDAGPGTDAIAVEDRFDLTIDLTAQAVWDDTGSAETPDARLIGFEGASAVAERVRLVGNERDNDLDAFGCDAAAKGGGGDDRLSSTVEPDTLPCSAQEAAVSFSGGAGNDVLRGGKGPDTLAGGRGRDRADGGKGTDLCRAEVRHNCEKR
jgi:Ca2+-binding RTX toxin-like protein